MKTRPLTFLEIPKHNSALVKEYEDFVSARADLDYLVADLNMVGKFTQIAFNGVAGYTVLQIKIRRIGVNVSRLSNQSTNMVWEFERKSRTIVVDLQTTYQFLIDGMEDMAIVILRSFSNSWLSEWLRHLNSLQRNSTSSLSEWKMLMTTPSKPKTRRKNERVIWKQENSHS